MDRQTPADTMPSTTPEASLAELIEPAIRAAEAGDWPEALRHWHDVHARFPDHPVGPANAAAALRALGRLDEAEALLRKITPHFSDSIDIAVNYALVAQLRADWPEALRRWQHVQARFPDHPAGHAGTGAILREVGRLAEAEATLSAAQNRFPDSLDIAANRALVAQLQGDLVGSLDRWRAVQERFPDHPAGFGGAAGVLRQQDRLDEADAITTAALARFPDSIEVAVNHALVAQARADWPEALARWQAVRERFPDHPSGTVGAGIALREMARLDEAEALLAPLLARFPGNAEVVVNHAAIATARADWPEAVRRWRAALAAHPQHAAIHAGAGTALREAGLLDESEALLQAAVDRFPPSADLLVGFAQTASLRRDWPAALRRWDAAKALFPNNAAIMLGRGDAIWLSRMDAADDGAEAAHGAPSAGAAAYDGTIHAAAPFQRDPTRAAPGSEAEAGALRELLMQFESLGDNCEFGSVQRQAGAEPLGLLRFVSIAPEGLLKLLETGFEGVGDPANTTLDLQAHGEYFLTDTRGLFQMHTFMKPNQVEPVRFREQQCRRLRYLAGKLVDDLTRAEKIFLFKRSYGQMSDETVARLHRAMRQYGDTTLLCVRLQDEAHPTGSVERAGDGVMVGYIDKFVPLDRLSDVSFDGWYRLCRGAHALWKGTPEAAPT